MTRGDWVTAALTDDAVVVDLLFLLKKQPSESPHKFKPPPPPPLGWGHRQRRSKPAASSRKELCESMRCSPTTPLSWSFCCDTGVSDDSCRPSDRSSVGRSKTFDELKEEESLLLKERIHLNKELANLRVTLKEQTARSENLKRLKLDLHLQSANKMAAASDELKAANSHQPNLAEASNLDYVPVAPAIPMHCRVGKVEKEVETRERCFILPDLNMTPSEEVSGCETLYGLS